MKHGQLQFLADSVIAQEIALSALVNALLKNHPDLTADYLATLEHVLTTAPIPTPGARKKLAEWRAAIAANQSSAQARH